MFHAPLIIVELSRYFREYCFFAGCCSRCIDSHHVDFRPNNDIIINHTGTYIDLKCNQTIVPEVILCKIYHSFKKNADLNFWKLFFGCLAHARFPLPPSLTAPCPALALTCPTFFQLLTDRRGVRTSVISRRMFWNLEEQFLFKLLTCQCSNHVWRDASVKNNLHLTMWNVGSADSDWRFRF